MAFIPSVYSKDAEAKRPEAVGLYFHANWCSSCKALDPALEEAAKRWVKDRFLLVTLDVTNKATQHQAGMMAGALGFDDAYEETGLKTGFVIILDEMSGEVLARITDKDSVEEMVAKVKSAIDKTR